MGRRSFSLIVPVAAVVVFALLVVVPPPVAMSAGGGARARPSSRVGPRGSSIRLLNGVLNGVKTLDKLFKLFKLLKKLAGRKSHGELVENSADTAFLFIFNLTVGTSSPPQNITGVLDITSPLVWSQCSPCGSACLPPPAPVFEPSRSSTFARLPCGSQTCQQVNETCSGNAAGDDRCFYTVMYESGNTTGYLANDTFTFADGDNPPGPVPVPGLVFGCSDAVTGNLSGVFGLSRGPLSLVSQLQLPWFSYFMASDDDSSHIQFGGDNAPPQTKNSRSTPLLNSTLYPDLYSVKLI